MKRVTGIGGIFFKAKDPATLRAWYQKHLGIDAQSWGAVFNWNEDMHPAEQGSTSWNIFDANSDYFEPGTSGLMINYRVADLHGLLQALRDEGCQVLDKVDESDFGKFGWVIDPEGNKIELWEPPVA